MLELDSVYVPKSLANLFEQHIGLTQEERRDGEKSLIITGAFLCANHCTVVPPYAVIYIILKWSILLNEYFYFWYLSTQVSKLLSIKVQCLGFSGIELWGFRFRPAEHPSPPPSLWWLLKR